MTLEEIKQQIEQKTGVPASLLTGETAEECVATAKCLLAYQREHEVKRPKTAAEQFAEWYTTQQLGEEPDEKAAALADIEEAARIDAGGYPRTQDGGEVTGLPDARPAREQFKEWLDRQATFDPFKDPDGWKALT